MKKSRINHKITPVPPPQQTLSMGALAEGLADDFNNILTTVMGACSLIVKEEPVNIELLKYVAMIRSSAERAALLSDKLIHVTSMMEHDSESVDSLSVLDKSKKT